MNTIQLNLLETKQIAAYINGYSYALEGGYRIVAGEQGATEFQLTSVPQQYSGAKFTIQLINSHKQLVKTELEIPLNGKFTLPVGMAVEGYGQMLIWCDITHESPTHEINVEKVIWTPLKLKIWNTAPNWKAETITLTDEIIERLNQAEDDVRALEELVKNIQVAGNKVDRAGDTMTGDLKIQGAGLVLSAASGEANISLTFSSEEREGSGGIILRDADDPIALTYLDAPRLYENGARVYSDNNPQKYRMTVEGQESVIRDKDYLLKVISEE